MELLTLKELIQFTSGTSSELTKRVISGSLTLITNEDHEEERGTLLLIDRTNNIQITCLINVFAPQLLHTPLYMSRWVFVCNETLGIQYIEIQLSHIYKDAACSQSMLSQTLQQCARKFDACTATFHEPSLFLSSSIKVPVNLTGIVSAISILFIKPGSPASFFIQLVNTTQEAESVTASIMFYGDSLIKYYAYFQIGAAYMFQHLDLAILGTPAHTLFSFIDTQSLCSMITLNQFYNDIRIEFPTAQTPDTSPPLILSQQQTPVPNSTYTGRITRVVDSLFGIYELDRKLLVCLFHYLGYSPSTPFRVDTLIRLHHVHVAFIEPEDGKTSHLFQTLWRAPRYEKNDMQYMVLVACVKSHVTIVDMSMTHTFTETSPPTIDDTLKAFIYTDSLQRHCDFTSLIRHLEIYAALTTKCASACQEAYTQLRDLMFATTRTHTTQHPRDFVNDFFFNHATRCPAVGYDHELTNNTFRVVVDAYPFLNDVHTFLEQDLQDTTIVAAASRFEQRGHVHTQTASYSLAHPFAILGHIRTSTDGRLYLTDHTSRIPLTLCLSSNNNNSDDVCRVGGTLCVVRKGEWIKENLSFVQDEDNNATRVRRPVWCSYMVVETRALVSLKDVQPVRFQAPSKGKVYRLPENDRFKSSSLVAVHVVDKFPIKMVHGADGKVYFNSRVVVHVRPVMVGSREPQITTSKTPVILVLLSKQKSLAWFHDVHVGSTWMLEGNGPSSGSDKWVLDVNQHTLYPILIGDKEDKDAIQLTCEVDNDDDGDNNNVYPVSDVVLPNRFPDLQVKINPYLFEKTVCVQGVVVHKRLIDGFKTHQAAAGGGVDPLLLYETLGVGTGKFNRKLFVQLREINGLDVVNLYIDVDRTHYPQGCTVGSVVKVHHVVRRGRTYSATGIYGLADENSLIEVVSMSSSLDAVTTAPKPTRTLASFLDPTTGSYHEESDEIVKLLVYIRSVMSLTMRWLCQDCGSVVQRDECYGMCENAHRVFMANAFVEVSDGTSCAHVSVDGERLVFSMLHLTVKQADALKALAAAHGKIVHGSWEASLPKMEEDKVQRKGLHGYTLADLCEKAAAAGQFWLFAKNQTKHVVTAESAKKRLLEVDQEDIQARKKKKTKTDYIQDLKLQRVSVADNGRLIRTLEPRKLKLKAIDLEYPEARIVAYDVMNALL